MPRNCFPCVCFGARGIRAAADEHEARGAPPRACVARAKPGWAAGGAPGFAERCAEKPASGARHATACWLAGSMGTPASAVSLPKRCPHAQGRRAIRHRRTQRAAQTWRTLILCLSDAGQAWQNKARRALHRRRREPKGGGGCPLPGQYGVLAGGAFLRRRSAQRPGDCLRAAFRYTESRSTRVDGSRMRLGSVVSPWMRAAITRATVMPIS